MDGVFYINKPKGLTSFDVVAKLRKRLMKKSIGHTGTLDPNAEGLLIILVGKACKALPYCEHDKKEYLASFSFGEKRNTADIWGELVETREISKVSKEEFNFVLKQFVGRTQQIPPMTSAIKINGKKLIEYQREGITVEVPPRDIEIEEIECLEFDGISATIRAVVSKGTYIRTLCEDIAEKTGNLGTLTALTRTKIGPISLEQASQIEDLDCNSVPHSITEVLQETLPMVDITDILSVKQGKKMKLNSTEKTVLLVYENEVVAAYEQDEGCVYRCKRGLW